MIFLISWNRKLHLEIMTAASIKPDFLQYFKKNKKSFNLKEIFVWYLGNSFHLIRPDNPASRHISPHTDCFYIWIRNFLKLISIISVFSVFQNIFFQNFVTTFSIFWQFFLLIISIFSIFSFNIFKNLFQYF